MSKTKLALVAVVVGAGLGALYWLIQHTQTLSFLHDHDALRHWIEGLGIWGPLFIVALEPLAIVASPIPSGPIGNYPPPCSGPARLIPC